MEIDIEALKRIVLRHLSQRNVSVRAFALMNGLNQPTLHRFLTGENVPSIRTVNKILAGLEPGEKKQAVNF